MNTESNDFSNLLKTHRLSHDPLPTHYSNTNTPKIIDFGTTQLISAQASAYGEITGVKCVLDADVSQVILTLVGNMTKSPLQVTFKAYKGSESTYTFTKVGTVWTSTQKIYPPGSTPLTIGTRYTLEDCDSGVEVDDDATFTVPAPPIITSAVCIVDDWKTTASINLSGTNLTAAKQTFTITDPNGVSKAFEFALTDGVYKVTLSCGSSGVDLVTGWTYTVTATNTGIIVASPVTFIVPSAYSLKSVSVDWVNNGFTQLKITVVGDSIPYSASPSFIVNLVSSSFTFKVKFTSATAGASDTISVSLPFGWDWGQEYTVASAIEDKATNPVALNCAGVKFTTPVPSIVSVVTITATDSTCSDLIIMANGTNFVLGSYVISFVETSETKFVTVTSATHGRSSSFSATSGGFTLGTQYTVKSFVGSTSPVRTYLHETLTAQTPSKITTVNCQLDATQTTVTIILTGSPFVLDTITVKIINSQSDGENVQFTRIGNEYHYVGTVTGSDPFLALGETYTMKAQDSNVYMTSGLSFTVPAIPTCLSASVEWVNAGYTQLVMKMTGLSVKLTPTPNYIVTLSGSSYKFTVTFSSLTAGASSQIAVSLPFDLTFGQEYTIDSVIQDTNTNPISLICTGLKFTVPIPAIVTSVTITATDSTCTNLIITITGTNFVKNTYVISFEETTETKSITVSSTTQGKSSSFSATTGGFSLGTLYTLKSVVGSSTPVRTFLHEKLTTTTPSLITTADCLLDPSLTTVTVILTGSNFLINPLTVTIINSDLTPLTVPFTKVGQEYRYTGDLIGMDPFLICGRTYTLSVQDPSVYVKSGLSFTVPAMPTCVSASVEWVSPGYSMLEMKLTGLSVQLSSTPNYVVTLSGSSYKFTVTFSSLTSGISDPTTVSLPFDLTFGQEYTIDSVIQDTNTNPVSLICTDIKFTIPRPPIVTSVSCTPKDDNCADLILTLTGTNFVLSTFTVEFNEIANPITVTVTSTTIGKSAYFSVASGTLALGTLYTLKSVSESKSPFRTFLHQNNPVLTPSVITGVVCTLDATMTTIIITLTGSGLVSSSANIAVVNSSSGSDTGVFTKIGNDYQLSISLGTPFYVSGQNFTLRSLDTGLYIKPGLSFEVPFPPAVLGASLEWTNSKYLYLVLKVTGQGLPSSSANNFIVSLASSAVTFPVKFSSNTTGQSDPILVTLPYPLTWQQTYTLTSVVEDIGSSPQTIPCSNVMFTVPAPPRLTKATSRCTTTVCSAIRFYFEGENLSQDVSYIVTIAENSFTFTTNFYSSTTGQSEQITIWPTNPFPLGGISLLSITEANANPAQWVLTNGVPIAIPDPEITGVSITLDNTATTITIIFNGILITSTTLSIHVKDNAGNPFSIHTVLDSDVLKGTEVIYPTSTSGFQFGETYTLTSTNNNSIKVTPISFTVPQAPIVLEVEAICADVKCTTLEIDLLGLNFTIGPRFLLTLVGVATPIPFTCQTRTFTSVGPIPVGLGEDLLHSRSYTISSIIEDSNSLPQHILCDNLSFMTPDEPILTTIFVTTASGVDTDKCGSFSKPCLTMEHSLTRLHSECSTMMLQGSFTHTTSWAIPFPSLIIAHNTIYLDTTKGSTHSAINVGPDAEIVVDGAKQTTLESLSVLLPASSAVDVYIRVITGTLTITNCIVTGDIPKASFLESRHPSLVLTNGQIRLLGLETKELGHDEMATLTGTQSIGMTQLSGYTASSIQTQSAAGSSLSYKLSNTSSLQILSSSFTSCSSNSPTCLGGAVSFSLSEAASLVIQFCSFIGCCVNSAARGGAIGLTLSAGCSNYLLDTITFAHNSAGYGRDFFLLAQSLEESVTIDHYQFNLYPPTYIRSNALFGSDRTTYVEETDLFPFLFPNQRFKYVFVDSLGQSGLASDLPECGRETHPCMSMRNSMDHLLNPDQEEELTQCVLERGLVLMGDLVVTDEIDVELCGYLNIREQDGLILYLFPIQTYQNTQSTPIHYGRVRFDQHGSIGCKLSFGMTEIVPVQTVYMKHLEFVLPRFSEHPQPIIAIQSVCVTMAECVVKAADSTKPSSPLISFNATLTSMPARIKLDISKLNAQDIVLRQPLILLRSTSELPVFMDTILTGHAVALNQTSTFSLPPLISITDSVFERVALQLAADLPDDVVYTGIDSSVVVTPSPSVFLLTSHTFAVQARPAQNLSSLASPLSVANLHSPLIAKILSSGLENPSFLFDDRIKQTPLSSYITLTGLEIEGQSALDPNYPLPLGLVIASHSTPDLYMAHSAFVCPTDSPDNIGLIVVTDKSLIWPEMRHMLFSNCSSLRRTVDQ
ncbi:hypothetical protein BLNAU_1555 [Blattamonas nauphoetae]|uniref:Uncharacterized protein n=1 Tax=Blattamonas nauphoetae TaxID=2049346 RepID=A0ABQ9YIC1_9EUKA|nr:hypothetical protein BLNAU_1555 [Blattamonas nauphoetae]